MRQAGIVAAAGVMALERMVDRSPRTTPTPARWPRGWPRCRNQRGLASVQTNIVILRVNKGDRAAVREGRPRRWWPAAPRAR